MMLSSVKVPRSRFLGAFIGEGEGEGIGLEDGMGGRRGHPSSEEAPGDGRVDPLFQSRVPPSKFNWLDMDEVAISMAMPDGAAWYSKYLFQSLTSFSVKTGAAEAGNTSF
jgi:hypothetical protein